MKNIFIIIIILIFFIISNGFDKSLSTYSIFIFAASVLNLLLLSLNIYDDIFFRDILLLLKKDHIHLNIYFYYHSYYKVYLFLILF